MSPGGGILATPDEGGTRRGVRDAGGTTRWIATQVR